MNTGSNEEKSWVKIAIAVIGIAGTIGTSLVANEMFWKQFGNRPESPISPTPISLTSATDMATVPPQQDTIARRHALKTLSKLADEFDRLNKEERIAADRVIRALGPDLTLEDINKYSRESRRWGYRASAGTALAGLLIASPALVEQEYDRLVEIIDYNLTDSVSYVRYRYVVILAEHPKLAQYFRRELQEIAEKDTSKQIQQQAQKALQHLS